MSNQETIVGYFIEEAKEHLGTLERGLMNLAATLDDQEEVNELFRAAHSIKGGAGMLNFGPIQKTAHHLEDAFKILQENTVNVDSKLESLFLSGFDVLQDLVGQLESPAGFQDDKAKEIFKAAEPRFTELQAYLETSQAGVGAAAPPAAVAEAATPTPIAAAPAELGNRIRTLLKEMLQQFRQEDTPDNRQKLRQFCDRLQEVAPAEDGWQGQVAMARDAISNPRHPYRTLAPVVLKDLKRGSDLIELGRAKQIEPGDSLQQLARASIAQALMPVEPNAAATTLLRLFSREQLNVLIEALQAGT
ncbi:MAG: Hpt domain-containing protein [Cyanobacteria bacterium J06641_5]